VTPCSGSACGSLTCATERAGERARMGLGDSAVGCSAACPKVCCLTYGQPASPLPQALLYTSGRPLAGWVLQSRRGLGGRRWGGAAPRRWTVAAPPAVSDGCQARHKSIVRLQLPCGAAQRPAARPSA
jgi:hypothetical protein